MNRRCLFYLTTAGLSLVLLALVAKASLDRLSAPPWGNPTGDGAPISLEKGRQVGQVFVAPLPGLYRIEVVLQPPPGGSDRTVVFHLKADPADLWTASVDGNEISAGTVRGFEFPPQRNSMDRSYYFYLEAPDGLSSAAPALGYSPNIFLDKASAYLDGQPVAGNLQFRTFYTLRTRDKAQVLLSRLAEGRPYLLGSPGFYVALAGIYLLVLTAFLVQVARAALREEEKGS